jgi:hypothetical protein
LAKLLQQRNVGHARIGNMGWPVGEVELLWELSDWCSEVYGWIWCTRCGFLSPDYNCKNKHWHLRVTRMLMFFLDDKW